jgi:ankyrin repeat protein
LVSNEGKTAYDYAIDAGRKLVAYYIAEAAIIHAINFDDLPALLKNLQHGGYVNLRTVDGTNSLIYASSKNDVNAVNEVLSYKPDINRANNYGYTALHAAAGSGSKEIIETLLGVGIDPLLLNDENLTAQQIAQNKGFTQLVTLFPVPTVDL